ncbi:MAG TPA: homoserine kinase, partial [bacterium]|nr:homoserine kinase [bacterium]
ESEFIISVPASIGNLGSGFDCAAVSLRLFSTYRVRTARQLSIRVDDPRLPGDKSNLVWQAYAQTRKILQQPVLPLRLVITNRIPPGAGLGGSGSAVVAGVLAAFLLAGRPVDTEEVLSCCLRMEKHPDNVAASLLGGFVLVAASDRLLYRSIPVPAGWKAVIFLPEKGYPTRQARQILPGKIDRQQATFNISRCAFLTLAFLEQKGYYLKTGMEDALHQPYRAKLYPHLVPLCRTALASGASGCCLSGAGPSVAAICCQGTRKVEKNWRKLLLEKRWTGQVKVVALGGKTTWHCNRKISGQI